MARLFISCNNRDFALGRKLQRALEQRRHVMTLSVDAKPAGRWEAQLLRGVHSADAFIALLTANGVSSSWVMGQTGMAASCEYTKQMLVLPVCAPNQIPSFVAAFHCFFLTGKNPKAIDKLASDLDAAIAAHEARRPPRIFISHRHKHRNVASKLIDLIECAFHVEAGQIRCTSVPGYTLPVGSHSADSLKGDLNGAEIVMGLIGPDTTKSDYVLFELGASWGLGTPTFPLRIADAAFEHVPEVMREKSSLMLADVAQCLQLVEDIGRVSTFARKANTTRLRAAVHRQAQQLARASTSAI